MKLVIAIIQPHKLETVLENLYASKVNLVTITEVMGHGFEEPVIEVYRGVIEKNDIHRKIRLDIAVNDEYVDVATKAIIKGSKTGEIGDGKIFVLPLENCIRIRTEESGREAIG